MLNKIHGCMSGSPWASNPARFVRTVVLAYCMDEHAVLPWIVDVVEGRVTEEKASDFMARVIHVGSEGSDEPQSPS